MSPSEIQVEQRGKSVHVHIPIRREDVTVEKKTVIYEEVDVRRELVEESRPAGDELKASF